MQGLLSRKAGRRRNNSGAYRRRWCHGRRSGYEPPTRLSLNSCIALQGAVQLSLLEYRLLQTHNRNNRNQRRKRRLLLKALDERSFVSVQAGSAIVPPNSFALARFIEYFRIPRNVLSICVGKSTYARCGIIGNVAPFEPEWEGFATLEISNTTPLPAWVYANEGLCQILFFRSDEACEIGYADGKGERQ